VHFLIYLLRYLHAFRAKFEFFAALADPQLFVAVSGRETLAIFEVKVISLAFVRGRDIILIYFLSGQDKIVTRVPVYFS
jgi:hypothetical protein